VHCYSGCDAHDVLDALRRRGLVPEESRWRPRRDFRAQQPMAHNPDPEALKIWVAASIATGSIVERLYLPSRGITLPVPPSVRCGSRFHLDRYAMPTMVAAVQRADGRVVAVQTTLLSPAGKKATVSTARITTGALGAGAVRLAKATGVLGLAEGIETALSAMQLTGVPPWACLWASRMHRVEVPDGVHELDIFADNDQPGHAAAERTAQEHRHRRVVLRFPPETYKDWNDWLMAQAGSAAA
jgi:putative DNA primase/helicase